MFSDKQKLKIYELDRGVEIGEVLEVLSSTGKHWVQFSCSVMSDSVTPWTAACQASLSVTNSWSLLKLMSIESNRWCHPTISSSVIPFSFCLQSFPAPGSFPVSHYWKTHYLLCFPRGKEFQWSENLKTLSTNAWAVLNPSIVSDFFQPHVL